MSKYTPTTISNTNISGKARVVPAKSEKSGKNYWQLTMSVWDKKTSAWVQWDKPVTVEASKAPPYLKYGDWRVKLSADKSKIISAVPDSETVIAEFKDIAHAEGKPYAPFWQPNTYPGSEGKSYGTFGFIYRVVEGEFKGVEITDYVRYNFGPDQKLYKGRKVAAYFPGGKNTEKLSARLEALGVWEFGPIPYEGPDIVYQEQKVGVNILPLIAKNARRAVEELGRKVKIVLADGAVASIKEVLDDDSLVESIEDIEVGDIDLEVTDDAAPQSETLPEDGEVDWEVDETDPF